VEDWHEAARQVGGVLLRAGYRGYGAAGTLVRDARFPEYLAAAEAAGIPAGVYFVTQAVTEAEAAEEADFIASLVKGHRLGLPVYVDSEWSHAPHTGRADGLPAARRTDCVNAFCERVRSLGFEPGVYASERWFGSMLEPGRLGAWKLWCAKYSSAAPDMACSLWQYTDSGSVRGIRGSVDVSRPGAAEPERYEFPLAEIDRIAYVPMAGAAGETVSAAAVRARWNGRLPDVICNAELFSMSTHKPASGVVCGGVRELLTQTLGAAFVGSRRPVLSYADNVGAPDWVGAYPCLVRDGKVCVEAEPRGLSGRAARTALAWNAEKCAVFYAEAAPGARLAEFAEAIAALGYTEAINLDGGGSTAVVTPESVYDQGRAVRGKIGVWLRDGCGNKLALKDGAMRRDMDAAGGAALTVTADGGLNLRAAPGGTVKERMPKGSAVRWYGFYCVRAGVKWLYVRAASGTQGYAAAEYLGEGGREDVKERLTRLIDVKSIVTIVLTVIFGVLALRGVVTGQEFLTVFTVVIAFYYGTQAGKTEQKA